MPYDLGDPVGLSVTIRDAADDPVNASNVDLTITLPDQTVATPTITNPPTETGVYVHDYATTQAGRHSYRWVSTGPASAFTDQFDVRATVPGYIVSLADAKKHLNMSTTVPTDDEELRGFIEAATEVVERHRNEAVAIRSFTEVHSGGCAIPLNRTPVLSVTTLAPVYDDGTSYLPADVDVDTATGIVRKKDGAEFAGPLRVTYTAGRTVVPPNYTLAAHMIIQHLWLTQRGPGTGSARFAGDDDESTYLTGMGFSVPHRALELLGPSISGIA